MAILQEAAFSGVDANDARPNAIALTGVLESIAKGQAWVYESITGVAVPDAAGISAAPHIHDGTDGALVRTPLASGVLEARLAQIVPTETSATPGWEKIVYVPFFVPAGFSEVSLVLVASGSNVGSTVRAVVEDTSFAGNEEPKNLTSAAAYFAAEVFDSWEVRLAVNPGVVNILRIDAWAGKSLPGAAVDDDGPYTGDKYLYTWQIVPVNNPHSEPVLALSPTIPQQLLSRGYLQSFDANYIQADKGLDTWVLRNMAQNDGLLRELLTGRPAGTASMAQRQRTGHRHADNGAADLDDSGALVDTSLGAWGYGVMRGTYGPDTGRIEVDEVRPTAITVWTGRIIAPNLKATTSAITVALHCFRLPATLTSHLTGTSVLKFAVLLYSGTTDGIQIGVTIGDADFATLDSETVVSDSVSGVRLVTGEVDGEVDGSAALVQDDILCTVRLRAQAATAKTKTWGFYGLCLYLEAP